MTLDIREALEADIDGTYGSGFNRKEKPDSRYNRDVSFKAQYINDFLQNVDGYLSVSELIDRLEEIIND